ncbi:MAG: efflux RND transporter periplasmic adaptor subunit [FCB group bacterium]|jgi:membrane fusion protein (multidrug efflux system)|nr:efflux RND transporter periplasmic adaptor subunit [FCB group bacterium]
MYTFSKGSLAVLVLVLAAACQKETQPVDASVAPQANAAKEAALIPVQAEKPTRGDITQVLETNARIIAERRVDVTSEGMGKCIALFAEEGQSVKQGEVLVELDKQEALAALNQAEVQVRQQLAAFDRAKKMYEGGIGPLIDFENARFAYEQSVASRDLQKVQLDNMTIRAPISGVVTRKNVQLGMLVTSGTPVYSIVDPTSYVLAINPPERDLPRLTVGQEAKVAIDALPGEEFAVKVSRVNPSVENGTVKAMLAFDPEALPRLKEGAFARVALVMDVHRNALLVPKDAVLEENGRQFVYVVEPGPAVAGDAPEDRMVARRADIETGFDNSASVEVVSGLDDNSLVTVVGQHTLKSGAEVVVTRAEDEFKDTLSKTPEEALDAAKAERAKGKQPMAGGGRHM